MLYGSLPPLTRNNVFLRNIQRELRRKKMATVTSAEAQKNFGRYREQALEEPVIVTQYGKPSVVMVSAAEYERQGA